MVLNKFSPQFMLYFLASLASIALSLWLNSGKLINYDGVLYLEAAQAFLEGGVHGASAVYAWPFYSILIAVTHQITTLSLEHAAVLLNTIFALLIVTAFIRLTASLGGVRQVQIFAAILILLHTGVNDYRDYIIRDFGHLAFMLYSLYFFICYAQTNKLRFALAWNLMVLLAALFRSEASLLFLSPFVFLLPSADFSWRQRLQQCAKAYLLPAILGISAILAIMLFSSSSMQALTSIPFAKIAVKFNFFQAFDVKISELRPLFPQFLRDKELPYILVTGLLGYFVIRCMMLVSPLYTLLAGYAVSQHAIAPSAARKSVITYIAIYTAIPLLFLFFKFFLAGRYILPLALLLSLWAPFGINAIFEAWRNRTKQSSYSKKYLFPAVLLGLAIMLGDSVVSTGTSHLYLKDAGVWLSEHTAPDARVYTNSRELGYYSHRKTSNTLAFSLYVDENTEEKKVLNLLNTEKWKNFDYYAIVIKAKNPSPALRGKLAQLPLKQIASFENERGDQVIIFEKQGR